MSPVITYRCDGHRHGQPCRGALPTHTDQRGFADDEAAAAGWWNIYSDGAWLDMCPSRGHDEETDQP